MRFIFNLYTRVIVVVKQESGGGRSGRLRLQANQSIVRRANPYLRHMATTNLTIPSG